MPTHGWFGDVAQFTDDIFNDDPEARGDILPRRSATAGAINGHEDSL